MEPDFEIVLNHGVKRSYFRVFQHDHLIDLMRFSKFLIQKVFTNVFAENSFMGIGLLLQKYLCIGRSY